MVLVRKKSRGIMICIDFWNLNRAFDKEKYPIPPMEHLLKLVSGSKMFSLLDGFSGYNQVLIVELDQSKTIFKTKWGTYTYCRIPFGLINVGTTFQREMDIAFKGIISQSVVIYLDDVTIYSKQRDHHPKHLKKVSKHCMKYGIS
jgi:hypothetical protein